ncbi:MAG: hypothetical protein ACLTSK_04150 [Christensenellales bacterium]
MDELRRRTVHGNVLDLRPGLVTVDTFLKWTGFGQVVILILIQIGGLGFMTVITTTLMVLGRKIGLYERKILMQSAGTMRLSGIVHLVRRITIGTAIFEGAGALLLATRLCPKLGFWEGLYSPFPPFGFLATGFDLRDAKPSVTRLRWAIGCVSTIMGLISVRYRLHRLGTFGLRSTPKPSLHTKSPVRHGAHICGTLLFWLFEKQPACRKSAGESFLSMFMSVTPARQALRQ